MDTTKGHVLIVDDDLDTCEMMKSVLGLMGYEATAVQNADDALAAASSRGFSMYVSDVRLPELSGLDLCRHLRSLTPDIPVIFISGAAYEADRLNGMNAGAAAYLTKPLNFDLLEATMIRVIDNAPSNRAESA